MSFDVMFDVYFFWNVSVFLFQAEDGIRDLVRSRGLGDVYKRQDVLITIRINIADLDRALSGRSVLMDHPRHRELGLSLIHI